MITNIHSVVSFSVFINSFVPRCRPCALTSGIITDVLVPKCYPVYETTSEVGINTCQSAVCIQIEYEIELWSYNSNLNRISMLHDERDEGFFIRPTDNDSYVLSQHSVLNCYEYMYTYVRI